MTYEITDGLLTGFKICNQFGNIGVFEVVGRLLYFIVSVEVAV